MIAVWAHNAHVSKAENKMGHYLENKYENKYLSIAFSSGKGEYGTAKKSAMLTDPDPRCYEYFFPKSNFFLSLIDARQQKADASWLNTEKLMRHAGGINDLQFHPSVLTKEFDFLYYIEETSPSKEF